LPAAVKKHEKAKTAEKNTATLETVEKRGSHFSEKPETARRASNMIILSLFHFTLILTTRKKFRLNAENSRGVTYSVLTSSLIYHFEK
jgi:hypothetical protein